MSVFESITDELQVEYTNPLFSGELVGEMSFGVKLPLTSSNKDLLEITNQLHYDTQKYQVMISDPNIISHDAEMTLDRIDLQDEVAECTVFVNKNLYSLLNTPIAKLNPDSPESIIPWHCFSYRHQNYQEIFPQYSSNRILPYCNGGNKDWYPSFFRKTKTSTGISYKFGYYAFKSYQYHPNIALSELIDKLRRITELELQLDTTQIENYPITRIVATHKRVSPHNKVQWVYWSGDDTTYSFSSTNSHYRISVGLGGQHITNDCEGTETDDFPRITFNRNCKMKLSRYSCSFKKNGTAAVSGTLKLKIFSKLGTEKYELASFDVSTQGEYQGLTDLNTEYSVEAGDFMELSINGNSGNCKAKKLRFWGKFEFSDYEVNDEDYNEELQYNSGLTDEYTTWMPNAEVSLYNEKLEEAFIPAVSQGIHKNSNGTLLWNELPCYSYFGIYTNLGELTFTDLILGICYNHNLFPSIDSLKIAMNSINLTNYQSITQYEKLSVDVMNDIFAKDTGVLFGNDKRENIVVFRNSNLENERNIYEFNIGCPKEIRWKSGQTYQTILYDQYSIGESEPNENGTIYQGEYSFNDLPPFMALTMGNSLGKNANSLKIKEFFSNIQSSCVYNFRIFEPINNILLAIEGHLYMVHSYLLNVDTGVYELKAIKL